MKGKHLSWITIWLLVVCLLLAVSGTYAVYSSVKYAQGVAVAKTRANKEDVPFSSNYLTLRETGEASGEKMAMISKGQDEVSSASVPITVCNYPQNDRMKFHKGPISYVMTATLLDARGQALTDPVKYQDENGNEQQISLSSLYGSFSLDGKLFTVASCTSSGSLAGGTFLRNTHRLECTTPALLNVVSILVEVVPSCSEEGCPLSGWVLRDRLKILMVAQPDQGWTGTFIEDRDDINSSEVDAFNYVISGTAEQSITIKWKKAYVEISHWSLEDLGLDSDDIQEAGENRWIVINVGGEGKPTSYRLQFYRTNGYHDSEDIKSYVAID